MERGSTLHREEIIEMLEEFFSTPGFEDFDISGLKDKTTEELLDLLDKTHSGKYKN